MDPFDKLAQDIAAASNPLSLARDWPVIQAGVVAAAAWKKQVEARLAALEAHPAVSIPPLKAGA